MDTCSGRGTILGGLPVWADVYYGKYADTPNGPGEDWAKIKDIYWLKRNGQKGGSLPQKVVDRARRYDHYFCDLIEQVFEYSCFEKEQIETLTSL